MPEVLEIDVNTGVVTERNYTAEELALRAEDEAAAQAAADKEAADKTAREAAIAHAKSLGFTDEMIAVMYPGLTV